MTKTKRILSLLLALVLSLSLVACSTGGGDTKSNANWIEEEVKPTVELDNNSLYLITDLGTIDDKSFNQGSFDGLKNLASNAGVEANYIRPTGSTAEELILSIGQAVEAGSKLVVTPGHLFIDAVGQAQNQYPETMFVAVDYEPAGGVAKNTTSILFKEEQSGFLAGYAAVKDGYRNLGFMGGIAVPAVIKFGFGFIAGADYAARELGVQVNVKYNYTGSFEAKPEIQTMASSWFQSGTEVIFSCGGGIAASVLKAAQDNGGKMIGVDVDQKDMGEEVITSAMKNLPGSVYQATKSAVMGDFPGGQTLVLGVEENGVQLSDDFSRFKTFTKEDYDKIYQDLINNKDGMTDAIPNDISNADPSSFASQMTSTTIEYIEQ